MESLGLFGWIVFGGLAGWVASYIVGNRKRQGCIGNVIIGIIGAFVGGFLVKLAQGGDGINFGWDWYSFGVAVVGSCILLLILGRR